MNCQRKSLRKQWERHFRRYFYQKISESRWKRDVEVFIVEAENFSSMDKKDLIQCWRLKFVSSTLGRIGLKMPLTIHNWNHFNVPWPRNLSGAKPLPGIFHGYQRRSDNPNHFNDIKYCLSQNTSEQKNYSRKKTSCFNDASKNALISVA